MRHLAFALACASVLASSIARAQVPDTASLRGTISLEGGRPLERAIVTVSEESGVGGARRTETNGRGDFAFHALPAGRYLIQVERSGYRTLSNNVVVYPWDVVVFDATLEPGGATEPMAAPRREVPRAMSPALTSSLGDGLLQHLPFESRNASDVLLLAPGVNPANHSAFGAGGRAANRYSLDLASLGDPRGGGVWADGSYQWLQSGDVLSHGAAAEIGGYTGVHLAARLPSGGEHLTGVIETLFTNDALTGTNVTQALLDENPALREATRDYVVDGSGHLGGALRPGRAWYFAGAQFRSERIVPDGFPAATDEYSPGAGPTDPAATTLRAVFKPTIAIAAGRHLAGSVALERRHDDALFAGPRVTADATLDQTVTSWLFTGRYTHVLSSVATLDARYSGLAGSDDQSPHNGDTPGYYDLAQDVFAVNAVDFSKARRARHELGVTWSRLVSSHTVSAGAEFEISSAETETGYNGGQTIDAIFGVPHFAYTWEGDRRDASNRRLTAFVQDTWLAGPRLAFAPGVRLDRITGSLARADGRVFATTSIAPRVGLTWLPGAGSLAVRASYGWYFQGPKSSYYDRLDPGISPVFGVFVDANLRPLGVPTVVSPGTRHDIDDSLQQPRTQQAAVSAQREVVAGILVRVAGIYRRSDQFVDDVLQFENTEFSQRTIVDPGPDGFPASGDETGNSITGYNQLTDPFQSRLLVTNPGGAFQEYRGLELSATRRLREAWQVHASWVFSRTTGNYDDVDGLGNTPEYDTPNVDPRLQPLREGRLTHDSTHLLKALGTYAGPWQITAGIAFCYTSGEPFTRIARVRFNQGREDLFMEGRGNQRLGAENRLDARVERPFSLGRGSLSVVAEGFNLMNRSTITARTNASGAGYFTPTGVMAPRRFRLGAIYRF